MLNPASQHNPLSIIPGGKVSDEIVKDELYQSYGQVLREYSGNTIDDTVWEISIRDNTKTVRLHFDRLSLAEPELKLIKILAVDILSHHSSPSTAEKHILNLNYLFQFFADRQFHVGMLSTALFKMFHDWLDSKHDMSDIKKNSIESSVIVLAKFMQAYGLLRPIAIIPPPARYVPPAQPKKAPEKAVMQKMDRFILDFSNSVPTDIRCRYLLMRLLPLRNEDMPLIKINCFTVDSDGLLTVSLPTSKETANHKPMYKDHYRDGNGAIEKLLIRALSEQQKYAKSQQRIVKERGKGYLLVSSYNPTRILSDADFNRYLANKFIDLGITDSLGNPAKITSYSLRHMFLADSSHAEVLQAWEVQQEACHRKISSTFSYCDYASFDENQNDTNSAACVNNTVFEKKFRKLQEEKNTRLIGASSICSDTTCAPQHEHCIMRCDSYRPDPQYVSQAKACIATLQKHISDIKTSGQLGLLAFNKSQLAMYQRYLELVDGNPN